MAAITSTTESWNSHKFSEVESHIKGNYLPLGGGTLTGNLNTLSVSGSGDSNNLVFRHLDGQNCNGDYNLYLQYINADSGRLSYVYFAGNQYYINGGYYNGKSESANTADKVGDGTNYIYCTSNEVNFGGSYNSDTIEFGSTAKDSKPKPAAYKFGGSNASAIVYCSNIYTPNISSTVIGSGTYTTMRWGLYSNHYEFEFPNLTDSSSGTHIPIYFGWRGGVYPLTIAANTNVGISTTSPSYKLHVSGDIYATGGITSASDERMKNVICDTDLSLEQIAKAPTIRFTWKDNKEEGEQVGTIAQYWQEVLPEVVKDKSDELSIQYGVAALVSSITTARKVVDHEKEIKALKAKINVLEERISELEG